MRAVEAVSVLAPEETEAAAPPEAVASPPTFAAVWAIRFSDASRRRSLGAGVGERGP